MNGQKQNIPFIQIADVEHLLDWTDVTDALISGHILEPADIDDIMFKHDQGTLLNRAAWVQGLGIGVKTATIFPGNSQLEPSLPNVHAVFTLFNDKTGVPVAMIDGDMVTRWKTAGDSVLGARLLARTDSKSLLIVGAGVVAQSLIEAYSAVFTGLERISIWNRTTGNAQKLASSMSSNRLPVKAVTDLAAAVAGADIVSSATMSTEPLLNGEWFRPGTHVDLIGAFRPDMREADNDLIRRSELFVDSRKTAIHDIGELLMPLNDHVITEFDVRGDLYDLCRGAAGRSSDEAITLFKNGGGAHLDLMTATYIYTVHKSLSEQ